VRILVVDDDPDLRVTLAEHLREDGHVVFEARGGVEGLAVLRASPIDLVLLDLMMPDGNGWEFRREQLADGAIADVPVAIMSCLTLATHEGSGLGTPAAWLSKPIDLRRLAQIISDGDSTGERR